MALYIPHSIFYLARLLYVRPETFGPYYVLEEQVSRSDQVVLAGSSQMNRISHGGGAVEGDNDPSAVDNRMYYYFVYCRLISGSSFEVMLLVM